MRYFSFLPLALLLLTAACSSEEQKAPAAETAPQPAAPVLSAALQSYAAQAVGEFDSIPEDRRQALKKIALYVKSQQAAGQEANLVFICTHNSRRSHMSQIWAAVAAVHYGVEGVRTFSGGTEATAFNPRAVKALQDAGVEIAVADPGAGENPVYAVSYASGREPLRAFSKKYDAAGNPTENFCAVMTCSQADKNCPTIPGASLRVAIPYEDPKEYDGSPQEAEMYARRSRQIAREMFYLFSQIRG